MVEAETVAVFDSGAVRARGEVGETGLSFDITRKDKPPVFTPTKGSTIKVTPKDSAKGGIQVSPAGGDDEKPSEAADEEKPKGGINVSPK